MRKPLFYILTFVIVLFCACEQKKSNKSEVHSETITEVVKDTVIPEEEIQEEPWDVGKELIDAESMSNERGSTSATGSYSINRDENKIKIRMKFKAKKTGVSGSGKSTFSFAILNEDWEPIFKHTKGFTIGADALKGKREKKHNPPLVTITGKKAERIIKDGMYIAFTVNVEKDDSDILPQSLDEWKEKVVENLEFVNKVIDLDPSEKLAKKGWIFKKIGG